MQSVQNSQFYIIILYVKKKFIIASSRSISYMGNPHLACAIFAAVPLECYMSEHFKSAWMQGCKTQIKKNVFIEGVQWRRKETTAVVSKRSNSREEITFSHSLKRREAWLCGSHQKFLHPKPEVDWSLHFKSSLSYILSLCLKRKMKERLLLMLVLLDLQRGNGGREER